MNKLTGKFKKLPLLLIYLYPSALLIFSYNWVAKSFVDVKLGAISLELFFVGFTALSPVINLLANFIFFYFLSKEELRKQKSLPYRMLSGLIPSILLMSIIIYGTTLILDFWNIDRGVEIPMANLLVLSSILSLLNNYVFLSKNWLIWGLGWFCFALVILTWPANIYLPFIAYSLILLFIIFKKIPLGDWKNALLYFAIKPNRAHFFSFTLLERIFSSILVASFFWWYKIQYWLEFLAINTPNRKTSLENHNFSQFFVALVPYFLGMTLYYWLILPRLEKQINFTMAAISKHSLANFMKWERLLVNQFLGYFLFLILFLISVSVTLPWIALNLFAVSDAPNVHELVNNSLLTFGFILLHFLAFLSKFRQTIVIVSVYIFTTLSARLLMGGELLEPLLSNTFIGFWVLLIFLQIYNQLLRIYRFIFVV